MSKYYSELPIINQLIFFLQVPSIDAGRSKHSLHKEDIMRVRVRQNYTSVMPHLCLWVAASSTLALKLCTVGSVLTYIELVLQNSKSLIILLVNSMGSTLWLEQILRETRSSWSFQSFHPTRNMMSETVHDFVLCPLDLNSTGNTHITSLGRI